MSASHYSQHLQQGQRRYDDALEHAPFDGVLIYSGYQREQFLDDRPYPFAANPLFKHWLPLTEHPECLIHYRPGQRPTLYFFQPRDYWYKPPSDPEGDWVAAFDIRTISDLAAADAAPAASERTAFLGEPGQRFAHWPAAAINPATLVAYLHYHRAAKSAYEIDALRRASVIGARGHLAAAEAFDEGASEFGIYMAYLQACGQTDEELPYHSIIGLNEHAAILHYEGRESEPPPARFSFLIDAGASYAGYASDITRTYAARDGVFADLLAAMDGVQQRLCSAVRPGLEYLALHEQAHHLIAGVLADAGIVNLPPAKIVSSGLSGRFFPHGLGHLIGLQVHDVGGQFKDESGAPAPPPEQFPFLRTTRTLEPGFVVTIEPGLYFIDLLLEPLRDQELGKSINWSLVDAMRPCGGIRVEDDVVVTREGHENLTRDAFAMLAA